MFLFSLSALPWMLFVCHKALNENKKIEWALYLLWAVVIASFMASGYPWMNVINFVIVFLYACNLVFWGYAGKKDVSKINITPRLVNLLIFVVGAVIIIACYYLPGYFSLEFYYHLFTGDYISPEPRLRGLAPSANFSYRGISDTFFASIDPRILKNNAISLTNLPVWIWGTGWAICLLLFYRRFDKDFFIKNVFWITLLIFWLLYSAGSIGRLINYIPLFNANRWWFIGLIYVSISLIALCVDNLQRGFNVNEATRFDKYNLIVGFLASLAVLIYFTAPFFEYILVVCIIVGIYYLGTSKSNVQWRVILFLLMCLNTVAFVTMPHSMPRVSRSQQTISKAPLQNYYNKIKQRRVSVDIHDNHRRLGQANEYLFNDEGWLIGKVPFSHGYNPLGNPIYWYLKDESFLKKLVYLTQDVRLEKKILRKDFSTDNEFVNALIKDIQINTQIPTVDIIQNSEVRKNFNFRWMLKDFKFKPNQAVMNITVNDAGYLVFNNTFFPGWEVFVNGKKDQIISINRIFQGVYLDDAGDYDVIFKFHSNILISLLIFPSMVLLVSFIFILRKKQFSLA
jgi:hypothetical protein